MFKYILALLLLLVPEVTIADGTDVADNYLAGSNAGANVETDNTGFRATGNVFVGVNAGFADTTGSANVGLGYGALRALTTGYGNIGIGYLSGQDLTTDTHKLYIQNGFYPTKGIFGDFSTGYFGVNTTSPTSAWDMGTGTMNVGTLSYNAGAITVSDSLTVTGSIQANKARVGATTLLPNSNAVLGIYPSPAQSDTVFAIFRSDGTLMARADTLGYFRAINLKATTNVSGGSVQSDANGSASVAVFTRSSDTDTGLFFFGSTTNRLGVTAKGAQVAVFDSLGISNSGKSFGITPIAAMSDTTGWTGIRMFTFTGDTLYLYKADHTIVSIQ